MNSSESDKTEIKVKNPEQTEVKTEVLPKPIQPSYLDGIDGEDRQMAEECGPD